MNSLRHLLIAFVVVLNVTIGTAQEVSATKSVEKLKQMSVATAVVIRDGKEQEVPLLMLY